MRLQKRNGYIVDWNATDSFAITFPVVRVAVNHEVSASAIYDLRQSRSPQKGINLWR